MRPQLLNARRRLPCRLALDRGGKRGSILIVALWVLLSLSVFAVILGSGVRQKVTVVQRVDERTRLRLIAEAGILRGVSAIKKTEPAGYDAFKDPWAADINAYKEVSFGGGTYNVCYNEIENLCVHDANLASGVEVRWGAVDEERKININTVDMPVLVRLFSALPDINETQAQDIAAAIIDWRDSDTVLAAPGGAEDAYYTGLQYPYQAKNASFESLDELFLVKGITPGVFRKMKPLITVYGTGRVNINTTGEEVLMALGLNGSLVQQVIAFRQGKDALDGTQDDNIFTAAAEIVPRLSEAYRLGAADIAELSAISEKYLTVSSNNFMIRCLASLRNRPNTKETVCVFNRGLDKVIYWRD
jgi:type II secretory pathway component PulK